MNTLPGMPNDYSAILAHHQRALITEVLEAAIPARFLLIAPPGSGKTVAAMALVRKVAEVDDGYRILFIGPKAWGSMYEHQLAQSLPGGKVAVVTRAVFRELEEFAETGQPIWPDRFAAVFAMDTARQTDVLTRLCSVSWDLVIIEEVHLFARSRWTLLKTILQSDAFARVLLSTSTTDLKGIASLLKKIPRINWDEEDFANAGRLPPKGRQTSQFHSIPFHRTKEEVRLLREVVALADELATTTAGSLAKRTLFRQAASSPVALELTLRQWRNALAHGRSESILRAPSGIGRSSDAVEPETDSDVDASSFDKRGLWRRGSNPLGRLEVLLDSLGTLSRDSKREALENLLNKLGRDPKSSRSPVCVLCSSVATVNYLQTSIADKGIKAWSLTSESTSDKLRSELEGFANLGGVLVATTAMLQGIELPDVQAFVHFDAPTSTQEMLVRATRSTAAEHFVLVDKSGVLPDEWNQDGPMLGDPRA
jgi:hypothetical protein